MPAVILIVSIAASLYLILKLGSHYFDGDFEECFSASLTPWPFSMWFGTFWEDFGKGLKLDFFVLMSFGILAGVVFGLGTLYELILTHIVPLFGYVRP